MWTVAEKGDWGKPDEKALSDLGFQVEAEESCKAFSLARGAFSLEVICTREGVVKIEIRDADTGEEYPLAYRTRGAGLFPEAVREEWESILEEIRKKCFSPDVFSSPEGKAAMEWIRERYGVSPEFLWEKSPSYAVFRYGKAKKWFGVLMKLNRNKFFPTESGSVEVLNLKATPERVKRLVDGIHIFPAFHMNKKHWYTLILEKTSREEIADLMEESFQSVFPGTFGKG